MSELHKKQIGGDHYSRHAIQPWDVVDEYGLGFYEGCALKYLLRRKDSRAQDLKKAIHCLEKQIEIESKKALADIPTVSEQKELNEKINTGRKEEVRKLAINLPTYKKFARGDMGKAEFIFTESNDAIGSEISRFLPRYGFTYVRDVCLGGFKYDFIKCVWAGDVGIVAKVYGMDENLVRSIVANLEHALTS